MPLAHAKLNLWLNVVGRRADGYHLLDSLVAFTDLGDIVEVSGTRGGLVLSVDGPQAGSLAQEADNLVLKAARALAAFAHFTPFALISLTKNIPMAAGLGGGSADAAATLRALAKVWRLSVSEENLHAIGLKIGADVPMCLSGRTVVARGVGEQLSPAPALPPCGVLLVNPGVGLPTPEVFAARRGDFSVPKPVPASWPDLASLVAELALRGNDLAAPAVELRPAIGDVLAFLRRSGGARYAAMTGSGATCFALYDSVDAARVATADMPAAWWRHAGRFVSA